MDRRSLLVLSGLHPEWAVTITRHGVPEVKHLRAPDHAAAMRFMSPKACAQWGIVIVSAERRI